MPNRRRPLDVMVVAPSKICVTRALAVGVLSFVAPRTGAAQTLGSSPAPSLWINVAYPKLFYTARDGLTVGAYYARVSPLTYDQYDDPPPYRASFGVDAQLATSGSRGIRLEARLPEFLHGWRLHGALSAQREARAPYYGLGNASQIDDGNVTDAQPHFYNSLNDRFTARGDVQRQITDGLRLLVGFHAERWRIDTLAGASQLRTDAARGADPAIGRWTNDIPARVGLIFDTRDSESAPRRGVLLQAIESVADASVAGDVTYSRTTVSLAGHLPIGEKLVLAARAAGEGMSGTPHIGSFYWLEDSDHPLQALGGSDTHRALATHRLLGPDKLLANFDLRYDVYTVPTVARVTTVAFLDAGRVFYDEPFAITTRDLMVGGGAGLFLQFGRAGILGSTFGLGPDGLEVHVDTHWIY